MKTLIFFLSFFLLTQLSYAQKGVLSYEDLKYLIENNLGKADTFMVAKDFTIAQSNVKKHTRKYTATLQGGTKNEIDVRADGKKIFVEIQTNDISQYNLIHTSIAQFLTKTGNPSPDVQIYDVKHLGTIYITIADSVPYSPIRKDYDIHLVAEGGITSYN